MEHLDLELFFVFVCPIYPEKDGKLRQIPNVPNRSEALQRSGSPLVVPENVLEAQSGWKCWQVSLQIARLGVDKCLFVPCLAT